MSQQIGGQLEPGRDDGRIMGDFWREGKPRHSSQQQHRTDLAWNGLQYQQVAIGQLEGGGSTMEAHGMLSSLVVRRGKRTRALVGGEQAANERAERLKATWGGCRGRLSQRLRGPQTGEYLRVPNTLGLQRGPERPSERLAGAMPC